MQEIENFVHFRFYNDQNKSNLESNFKSEKLPLCTKTFDVWHLQCRLQEVFN